MVGVGGWGLCRRLTGSFSLVWHLQAPICTEYSVHRTRMRGFTEFTEYRGCSRTLNGEYGVYGERELGGML